MSQNSLRYFLPPLLLAALGGLFLAALEQTVLGPALEPISADLGGGVLLTWVPTAYLVAATACAPLLSAAADVIGRKAALSIAVALFALGSLLAALATALPLLVVARILQGAGAGGLSALPFVLVADLVAPSRRATVAAFISTIYAAASILGPLAGGTMVDRLGWAAIFWINLPICALILLVVWRTAPLTIAPRSRSFDLWGTSLLGAGISALLIGAERASRGGGELLQGLGLSSVGAILLLAFLRHQYRSAAPLVPLSVLTERTILLNSICMMCAQASNIGLAIYLPLYWQTTFALTPQQAGAALLALLLGVMSGAYVPPRILLRHPHYRPIIKAASILGMVGATALALTMKYQSGLALQLPFALVLGSAIGLLYPNFTLAIQNAASPQTMGAAIGVLAFMRAMGGTIGASLLGMIALSSGLLSGRSDPTSQWLLVLPAVLAMSICWIAAHLMQDIALKGFGKR